MFTNWVLGLGHKQRKQILVGVSAICWTIWISRNDIIFDKSSIKTYMHVLFRATYWCWHWALLQQCEERTIEMKEACQVLESMVMQLFVNYGWRFFQ
jgi:hypothetical protein